MKARNLRGTATGGTRMSSNCEEGAANPQQKQVARATGQRRRESEIDASEHRARRSLRPLGLFLTQTDTSKNLILTMLSGRLIVVIGTDGVNFSS